MALEDLFVTEVLRWRYAGALATVLGLQAVLPLLLCCVFRTLVVDQIWNPVSVIVQLWSSAWVVGLFWPSVCFLVLTRLHVHNYTVTGEHSVRVWHIVRALFRVRSLCVGVAVCVCVCALMHLYAAAAHGDFTSVVRPCYTRDGPQVCINSRTLVVLSCGVYCGVLHAAHYIIGNGKLVTMATVSVGKKQRMRSLLAPRSLLGRLGGSVWGTQHTGGIKTILGVLLVYSFMGGILEQWVATVLGSSVHTNYYSNNNNNPLAHSSHPFIQSVASLVLDPSSQPQDLDAILEKVNPGLQEVTHGPNKVNPGLNLNDNKVVDDDTDRRMLNKDGGDSITSESHSKNGSDGADEDPAAGHHWGSSVLSWQRLEILTDPMLALVLLFALLLTSVMLQLFYDIFAIFVMQPISLPVTPPMDAPSSPWVLGLALQASEPRLHALAYQQLAVLACTGGLQGQRGREPVFAISHPGGHPRNWNTLLTPTLSLIREFTDKLMKQNCPEEYAASQSAASATSGNTSSIVGGAAGGNTSLLGNTTLGNTSMVGNTTVGGNTSILGNTSTLPQPPTKPKEEKKDSVIISLRNKIINKLKEQCAPLRRLPLIRQLLAEVPDAVNSSIFATAQPVVWAIQGLSGLVTASFTEDQFGVVQRNMPQIMAALLHLNVVLDKTGRPPLPKRVSSCGQYGGVGVVGGATAAPPQANLRRGIKLALRTALYRLTHTFGDTLLDVRLPSNLKPKLQSYLDLMEG